MPCLSQKTISSLPKKREVSSCLEPHTHKKIPYILIIVRGSLSTDKVILDDRKGEEERGREKEEHQALVLRSLDAQILTLSNWMRSVQEYFSIDSW